MSGSDSGFDVAVVGGGPAGLVTALAVADTGASVALIAPPHQPLGPGQSDLRTAALFAGSIALLENLEVWPVCRPNCAAISAIRIIDDTGHLLRAPETLFRAEDVGRPVLGYNVPNSVLVSTLHERARSVGDNLTLFDAQGAAAIVPGADFVSITLDDGQQLQAYLVAAADGRGSMCRQAAGIGWETSHYDQSALVCMFAHDRSHNDISTEFHRSNGPLTTVPMPPGQLGLVPLDRAKSSNGNKNVAASDRHQSSLVWAETRTRVDELVGLDDQSFAQALSGRLDGLLGCITHVSSRARFPLSLQTADKFASKRIALIGEAGHVIPPIGAQGLNLSLRDAAVLTDIMSGAIDAGADPGGANVIDAYDQERRRDVAQRTRAVDMLNRTLTSGFLPIQLARGVGLHALKFSAGLRRRVMEEGLQPSAHLPPLMQTADTGR